MNKILKVFSVFMILISACFVFAACGNETKGGEDFAEKLELTTAMIGDVEFENGETVKLDQKESNVTISGNIDAMSKSQKNKYGEDDVDHVVVVKVIFDKERTISSFEIKGDVTKVYSDEKNVQNYAGKISDLLDNESGEDAYCNLILSAKTKEYNLTAKYSDGEESKIKVNITATLATAKAE